MVTLYQNSVREKILLLKVSKEYKDLMIVELNHPKNKVKFIMCWVLEKRNLH